MLVLWQKLGRRLTGFRQAQQNRPSFLAPAGPSLRERTKDLKAEALYMNHSFIFQLGAHKVSAFHRAVHVSF